MPATIKVDGKRYYHHTLIVPADGSPSPLIADKQDRQSFFKDKKAMRLDNTAGAYLELGGHRILFVIDKNCVLPGSGEWALIAETAARLAAAWPTLSAQAKKALDKLRAIVFSAKPLRSYADVRPDLFFYDTDEFRRGDGSLVSASWTASCVVHDANHIWQHDKGKTWHGPAAESVCWQLQIDNAVPLGLTPIDVNHLKSFLADPAKIIERANSKTFG